MDKLKIRFDPTDNALFIWFDALQTVAYLSPVEKEVPSDFGFTKK